VAVSAVYMAVANTVRRDAVQRRGVLVHFEDKALGR
jgi:hypothetical protein